MANENDLDILSSLLAKKLQELGQRPSAEEVEGCAKSLLADKEHHVFIGTRRRKAAGFGILRQHKLPMNEVSDIFTLPSFRNRGVAKELLGKMNSISMAEGRPVFMNPLPSPSAVATSGALARMQRRSRNRR